MWASLELKSSSLLDDLWPQHEREGVPEEEEPDWVKSEKEQFGTYRDKDGDGKLSKQEIGEWVLPQVGLGLFYFKLYLLAMCICTVYALHMGG